MEGSRGMSPASAVSMERHCHLPSALRGQPRGTERVGSLSPDTAKPWAGSSLSRQTRRRQPLWAQCRLPRWRRDVHGMESRATDPRNWAGQGHCWTQVRRELPEQWLYQKCPVQFALGRVSPDIRDEVDFPQLGSAPGPAEPANVSQSCGEGSDKERWCRKG